MFSVEMEVQLRLLGIPRSRKEYWINVIGIVISYAPCIASSQRQRGPRISSLVETRDKSMIVDQQLEERAEIKSSAAPFASAAEDYRVASPNPQNPKLHGGALLEIQ